jgi:hypothetical protein
MTGQWVVASYDHAAGALLESTLDVLCASFPLMPLIPCMNWKVLYMHVRV